MSRLPAIGRKCFGHRIRRRFAARVSRPQSLPAGLVSGIFESRSSRKSVPCHITLILQPPEKTRIFASFDYAGFIGRALGDDVLDVMLTLAANQALSDGVAPDRQRTRAEFPYFGEPYTHDEQQGLSPAQPATK